MMNTVPLFWWRWLVAACLNLMVVGLAITFLHGPIQDVFNWWLFQDTAGEPENASAREYIVFLFTLIGAISFGWGVLLLYVVWFLLRRGERSAWWAIALSLVSWFVFDSFYSLWMGYEMNVISNVALAGMFGIPLVATYRHLNPSRTTAG